MNVFQEFDKWWGGGEMVSTLDRDSVLVGWLAAWSLIVHARQGLGVDMPKDQAEAEAEDTHYRQLFYYTKWLEDQEREDQELEDQELEEEEIANA